MCAAEWTNVYFRDKITASNRKDHVMLCSAIDTDTPVLRRYEQKNPQFRSGNAAIGYHRHASDGDPMSGHGSDQPIARTSRATAAEAQTAVNIKAAYRSGPLRHTPRRHPRRRQVVRATTIDPHAVLDD